LNFLKNYYYLLLIISFLAALIWCFGYKGLGKLVLTKIWSTAGALLAVTLIYYNLSERLKRWSLKLKRKGRDSTVPRQFHEDSLALCHSAVHGDCSAEPAGTFESAKGHNVFPMFQLGDTRVTPWIIINAIVILLTFVFASRLLQAYLDYKVYPSYWG
jgi:small-conductance mechanosensitive channel